MGEVNITRAQGQLQRTNPTQDAVLCLALSGVAVADKIALAECKQIFSTDALTDLGIDLATNPLAFQEIKDFYELAGEGAELNIMLFNNATSLKDLCDVSLNLGKKLIDSTAGRAVIFMANVIRDGAYVPVIENGLDKDVTDAITKLQAMAVAYQLLNIPFVGSLPAYGFDKDTIAALPARGTLANDYVSLNPWCKTNSGIVSMGLLAGWLVKHQVHQNIGRVASGKVSDTAFMPDGTPAKDLTYQWATIAGKGLLVPVGRQGGSGFFFKDDPCMTAISSDYSSISWNRVMNKAQRIAAAKLVEKVNEDYDVNPSTGKIESSLLSDWESEVENAIRQQMIRVPNTKRAEISGVKCSIDPEVVNDELNATLNIVRKGQAKAFNVKIGFVSSI